MSELSEHGLTVLRALNLAVERCGLPLEGNLFFPHGSRVTQHDQPDPLRAHKRRNFLRGIGGAGQLLEIGFNAGHSALLALDRVAGLSYVGVDINLHPWTQACADVMQAAYPGRFRFVPGDSVNVLPRLLATSELGRIDAVHVDGGHDEAVARADVSHALRLVQSGGVVLVDDTRHPPIRAAIDDAVRAGIAQIETFEDFWEGDESMAIRAVPGGIRSASALTVVYSAVGERHIREAAISAASARRSMPWIKTLLVADRATRSPIFDTVVVRPVHGQSDARAAKINKALAIRMADTDNNQRLSAALQCS